MVITSKFHNKPILPIVVSICYNMLNHFLRYGSNFIKSKSKHFTTFYINFDSIYYPQDPIKNYRAPIKQLINWFDTLVVTRKREDIVNLIKQKMAEYNRNIPLPEIQLPTENGKLLELPDFTEEHGEFEEEEDVDTEIPEVFTTKFDQNRNKGCDSE